MVIPLYAVLAFAYALIGAAVSALYFYSRRLRGEHGTHLAAGIALFASTALVALASASEPETTVLDHGGLRFGAYLVAALCWTPACIHITLHYWDALVERMLQPGSRQQGPRAPSTDKEWWDLLRATLEALGEHPGDVRLRLRLAKAYYRLGYWESAASQYSRAGEWIDRGYAHAQVLYKSAHILVEKRGEVDRALPTLRRIVRLYPKSYFAAYSRRIIDRHEAHTGRPPGAEKEDGREKPM